MTTSASEPHLLVEFDEDGLVGAVSVAPRVLVEMITLAAESVPATASVVSPGRSRTRKSIPVGSAYETSGESEIGWQERDGVGVRIQGDALAASVNVLLKPGSSVPDAAAQIQTEIGVVVEKMLGLRTDSVAVHVHGFAAEVDS